MEILVCVKRVPQVGGKIVVTPDGQEVDTRMSGFAISPHEECAVEEAVQLTERGGGRVSVLTTGGERLVDAKGRPSYVTSAGSGPSVGRHLLMAYLPPEQARAGTKLAVEYFGDAYPVTVAVAGAPPLFDPDNTRVRS